MNTTCAQCGAYIEPGTAHSCSGPDYHMPIFLEILSELKGIREALGKDQQPTVINLDAQHKARKRETR